MLLVSGDDGENMTGDKDDYCQSGLESAESARQCWLGHRLEEGGRCWNRFYGDGISENYENRLMLRWLGSLKT